MAVVTDRTIQTSLGGVPIWGSASGPAGRPALFAIGGMFPPESQLGFLHDALPDHDVVRVRLPGMRSSPQLSRPGMAAVGEGFGEVIAAVFPDRPVTCLGVSVGCLAALAARHFAPQIDRLVLVEPFFQPAEVWPMGVILRDYLPRFGPEMKVWAKDVLGMGRGGVDYRPLLAELPARTEVILGEVPLEPPRYIERFPSYASEDERAMWRARPGVRLHICPGAGHAIPDDQLAAAVCTALDD